MQFLSVSENALKHNARATYYPMPDGSLRLARVQVFSRPRFKPLGWEVLNNSAICEDPDDDIIIDVNETSSSKKKDPDRLDLLRATRRARRNAFDLIMSNPDLDAFATFTYSPERVSDKASYDECYRYLRPWLSNGVQRKDLRYLCVPELTKKGDIHFHAVCNSPALDLVKARRPDGRLIKHHGDQVYNIANWNRGFSTAQLIHTRAAGDDPRVAVSKYIFKYMGKNLGAKIGGRYVLTGGKLAHPVYAYGDGVEQFIANTEPSMYSIDLPNGERYFEYDFLTAAASGTGNRIIG